jgi:hypothetical protein
MMEPRNAPGPDRNVAGGPQGPAKKDRLAAALRENLRRRKVQINNRRAAAENQRQNGPDDSQAEPAEGKTDL